MGLFTKIRQLIQIFPNSIEVNRTTRGYTYTIKMRCNKGDEDALLEDIKRIEQKLKERYGGDGFQG
jgi:hypothetical protein